MTTHYAAELVLFLKANKHLWDEETVLGVVDEVERVASVASRSTLLTPSDDEDQVEY